MVKQRILSIAALDTSGGAGLNQDIRVCSLLGKQLLTCPTGNTLQTKNGVEAIHPVSDDVFSMYLSKMLKKYDINYIKIGALCSVSQVSILLEQFMGKKLYKIVLDPVTKPSLGMAFIKADELDIYKKLLMVADFVAPNCGELSMLSGMKVNDYDNAVLAAKKLARIADVSVLVKSGHADSLDINEAYVSCDELYQFHRERQNWIYSHGTGCALSMAFTCKISSGMEPHLAFEKASRWVADLYDRLNS